MKNSNTGLLTGLIMFMGVWIFGFELTTPLELLQAGIDWLIAN